MAEWKKRFWSNTISSYIQVVVRVALGLILFRQLFSHLNDAEFGFWSLLWSLFGYGVLLDFGFGFTAQKAVAEKTAQGDIQGLSRLLATILWTFIGLAVFMMVIFLLLRDPFLDAVNAPPELRAEFTRAYLIFFVGMALMFPLGVFPEMLRGLQRIDLANWFNTATTVLHFAGIVGALWADWRFSDILTISVITSLLPSVFAAIMAVRRLPGLSLSPRLFQLSSVKSQMSFSLAAFLITFSNLLMAKSDQLVLSLTVGVAAVAIYQAGYKMGEMLNLFSVQLQSALSPAAADLQARGDRAGLRDLLQRSSRLVFLLITPAYALTAVYLESLIQLLTGLAVVPRETYWVGQALALAVYSQQLTNGASKRILMMCGHEKSLLFLSVGDAFFNVTLSVLLVYQFEVLGVALGTLIPAVLIGWILVLPLALRALEFPVKDYLRFHFQGTKLPLVLCLSTLALLQWLAPMPAEGGFWPLAWRGALAGGPAMLLSLRVLRQMTR